MKKIKLKIDFEVPDKFKFIAQDSDGELVAYTEKPEIDNDNEYFFAKGEYLSLADGEPNPNWRESLREI
jgi:hypothetical protein